MDQIRLIRVMKKLTNSQKGFVMYDSLCEEFGKTMIQHNLIYLRPTSCLSFDIPPHENPIITAESPAALVAMKQLLSQVNSEKELAISGQ